MSAPSGPDQIAQSIAAGAHPAGIPGAASPPSGDSPHDADLQSHGRAGQVGATISPNARWRAFGEINRLTRIDSIARSRPGWRTGA